MHRDPNKNHLTSTFLKQFFNNNSLSIIRLFWLWLLFLRATGLIYRTVSRVWFTSILSLLRNTWKCFFSECTKHFLGSLATHTSSLWRVKTPAPVVFYAHTPGVSRWALMRVRIHLCSISKQSVIYYICTLSTYCVVCYGHQMSGQLCYADGV